MRPDVYTPTFRRAMTSYVNNGFFARDLDADDWAFIEQVRQRGALANGTLGNNTVFTEPSAFRVYDEEIKFWENPWEVEPHVERVVVPRPAPVDPEIRRARQEKRKRDKEMQEAALEAERIEWAKQQRERLLRQLRQAMDDIEWEQAAPPFGKVDGRRRYVPQWKCDEERKEPLRRRKAGKLESKWWEAKRAAERKAEHARLVRMEAEMAEAHENVRIAEAVTVQVVAAIKNRIISTMTAAGPRVWSIEDLAKATECSDQDLLKRCIGELLAEGKMRTKQT